MCTGKLTVSGCAVSLLVMRRAWNKGKTKETSAAVRQISETMKSRGVDNFATWRKGHVKLVPKSIPQDGDLAELIGAVLGDGYIGQHERTQVLRIVSNSDNPGFVRRYSALVERSFQKTPRVSRRKQSNTIDIVIYQKAIAERLGLETGAKTHRVFELPDWIKKSKTYKLRFLRGLYETDGCHAYHSATYTHKFIFSNVNESLLDLVFVLLCELGFHPTKTEKNVQISRKAEVEEAVALLKFRDYLK